MKKLYIVNTALFTSVAALHALRLVYSAPVTIWSFEVQLWLSAVAVAGTALLAWLNWRQVTKHTKADWLWLLICLIVIDAFIGLYSWVADIAFWGISGDTFLWFVIIDLLLVAIIHGSVRNSGSKKKR